MLDPAGDERIRAQLNLLMTDVYNAVGPDYWPEKPEMLDHIDDMHRDINDALHEFHVGDADSLEAALERGSQAAHVFRRDMNQRAVDELMPIGKEIDAQRQLSDDQER